MELLVFLVIISQISKIYSEPTSENAYLVPTDAGIKSGKFMLLGKREEEKSKNYLTDSITDGFLYFMSFNNKSQCELDADAVFQKAANFELWALKMLDASAKLPSGILSGNLNQLGDYDECVEAQGEVEDRLIRGMYCLANMDVQLKNYVTDKKLKALDDALHSNRMLRNDLSDPGHRIPKMETFNWALCVPSSCTAQEIEVAFNDYLSTHLKNDIFKFKVSVPEELCYVNDQKEVSIIKILVRCFLTILFVLPILIPFINLNKLAHRKPRLKRILECFCIKKNWKILCKTDSNDDEISCIHGGRFLFAVGLLLSHKQIAMLFFPMYNRTAMSEAMSKGWTMLGRSAILYTDSFLLISGLLVSYSFVKDLDKTKTINFIDKLITRIFRFTPNLFGIILFSTFIMEDMADGPQWGLVVSKYANLCKKHMWKNFLYIHNYFGFDNMCLTHTHQLGIDMQLFIFSPIFVYALWKFPKFGYLILFGLSIVSTWLRYSITLTQNLSTILYYGISVEQLWRTANNSYILPTHRLTVYLSGIMLGYYLRRGGRFLKLSSFQLKIYWILSIAAGAVAVFGPYAAAFKTYNYNPIEAARFNAFAPILWILFLVWIILACVNGFASYFNTFLSWKYFRIFTRLSYAVYLTQFPVFFYNVGQERGSRSFKGFYSLFNLPELFVIVLVSVLLTLTFDIPFQEIRKLLRKSTTIKEKEVTDSKEVTENVENIDGNRKKKKLQSFGT